MRALLAAAALLLVALVVGVLVGRSEPEPRAVLEVAVDSVPASTATLNFTDWHRVRAALGGAEVSIDSPVEEQQRMLSEAYATDLSGASALAVSADGMREAFDWTVLDLRWEAFAQSSEGAVTVAALEDRVSTTDVTTALEDIGFTAPAEGADDGGVWVGGADLLASQDIRVIPQLSFAAVLPDLGVMVLSDAEAYAARTVDVIRGGEPSMASAEAVLQTALPLAEEAVAVVHAGARGCEVVGFTGASPSDQRAAGVRAEEAGGVLPASGIAFGLDGAGAMRVVQHFTSQAGAADQRDVRALLAIGPATGQGGLFEERFTVESAAVSGSDVVLDLAPVEGRTQLLTDLAAGPFLPAWCGEGTPAEG